MRTFALELFLLTAADKYGSIRGYNVTLYPPISTKLPGRILLATLNGRIAVVALAVSASLFLPLDLDSSSVGSMGVKDELEQN